MLLLPLRPFLSLIYTSQTIVPNCNLNETHTLNQREREREFTVQFMEMRERGPC